MKLSKKNVINNLALSMRRLLELVGEVLCFIGRAQSQFKVDWRVVPWDACLIFTELGDDCFHATLQKAGHLLTKS